MERSSRWVAIQRNPKSGSGLRRPLLEFIRSLRTLGIRPRLFSQRERLDACLQDPVHRQSLHGIVAAGGDGTILDLINRHPGIPVGVLPLGTENLVARQFRIPRNGAAAAAIVAGGRLEPLDIGRIDGKRFAIMASAGFDAEVIHQLHQHRSGHIDHTHYLRPILSTLRTYRHPELRVYADDATEPVSGRMVVVANLSAYALRLGVVPTAEGCDGWFDVRIFQKGSAFQIMRYLYMVARKRHDRLPDVICLRARTIRIEADAPVPLQADGDPVGTTPCEISIDASSARLFVP
ncbi:MAG: hypothetical protein DWQ34_05970 [Planctomycetota bacterium]|nr:MAG: hypothetical protein DWQ34_05970 [Planctomycetota bacterium]REK26555.1 MAG: hypothetical protein DWQ41_09840 [Planctomycetota bacterium]REK34042.1 MAG: hypothetical protein DWQ45_13805 [Planctomycetota bacterium]